MEEQNEQNEQNEQTVDIGKAQAAALKKGIAGTLLVCVGLVAGAYALGFFNGPAAAQATPEETQAVSWKEGAILDGGGFVVNLADRDRARYAKVSYSIVLAEGVDVAVAEERLPMVKDRIMPFLMERTSRELSTPDGFRMVRERLTEEAQTIFMGQALRGLVTELIVQ